MITLNAAHLQECSLKSTDTELIWQDILYVKTKFFAKKHKENALNFISEYDSDNISILLIEHNLFFTVWLEKAKSLAKQEQTVTNEKEQPIKQDRVLEASRIHPLIKNESQMIEEKKELEDLINQRLGEFGL